MARTRAANNADSTRIVLGLRQNLAQFMLLVAVNALVGGTLGQERTVLPLFASRTFRLDLYTSALTYFTGLRQDSPARRGDPMAS